MSVDALALVRFGLRAADYPRILNTIRVIDAVLKVDTPKGPCWHRYNHDGYGEHDDGSPFNGSGIGRAWPLLVGERAHYELAAGNIREARRLLGVMEALASDSGLISEQVWDTEPIPDKELFPGRPSGSARPLVWGARRARQTTAIAEGRRGVRYAAANQAAIPRRQIAIDASSRNAPMKASAVESMEVAAYRVPTDEPESDGTLKWDHTDVIVVHVTADGSTGLGWTYAASATADLIQNILCDRVIGQSAMAVEGIWAAMNHSLRNAGGPARDRWPIAAVDIALWDLKAKLLGISLVDLFGSVREAVRFTAAEDSRVTRNGDRRNNRRLGRPGNRPA